MRPHQGKVQGKGEKVYFIPMGGSNELGALGYYDCALDPCYTGKTFHGILQMLREGKIRRESPVIMLHTGGMPGIYTPHHRIEMERELLEHIHIM